MTREKGQGFSRRVTLENLHRFKPLLSKSAEDSALSQTKAKDTERKTSRIANPELAEAESLFKGEPLKYQVPFKRPSAKRAKRAIPPANAAPIASKKVAVRRAISRRIAAEHRRGLLLWKKTLNKSDAQIQAGHPTGVVRLTQAKWEVDGKRIDHTIYFREVFCNLSWTRKNQKVEEASVKVEVTFNGECWGIHELAVSHKPSGEAGQRNYTTSLHWKDLATKVKEASLAGKTLYLYGPPEGASEPFFMEII